MTLINYFPWRAIDKYYHYLGMQPGADQLVITDSPGANLVLIRGDYTDYSSTVRYNPIDFYSEASVYAWDTDPQATRNVLEAYSDRFVWFVNGPNVTKGDFELVAGPIAAQDLLQGNVPFP